MDIDEKILAKEEQFNSAVFIMKTLNEELCELYREKHEGKEK